MKYGVVQYAQYQRKLTPIQYCRVPKNGELTGPAWIVLIFQSSQLQSHSYFSIRLRVTCIDVSKIANCRAYMVLDIDVAHAVTHAVHVGAGAAAEMFQPVEVESFRLEARS